MKTYFLILATCAGFLLHSCGESLLDSGYTLELPELPQSWEAILGQPYWRIEWLNSEGRMETTIVRGNNSAKSVVISLPQTFAGPVSAKPFWPDRGLRPGVFRPAGAIFPFDASGKSLVLSWQGGVDANLYWEFISVAAEAGQETVQEEEPMENVSQERAAVPRLPWNFDWPRFRLLFKDPSVNAELRADPWLADWAV